MACEAKKNASGFNNTILLHWLVYLILLCYIILPQWQSHPLELQMWLTDYNQFRAIPLHLESSSLQMILSPLCGGGWTWTDFKGKLQKRDADLVTTERSLAKQLTVQPLKGPRGLLRDLDTETPCPPVPQNRPPLQWNRTPRLVSSNRSPKFPSGLIKYPSIYLSISSLNCIVQPKPGQQPRCLMWTLHSNPKEEHLRTNISGMNGIGI